MKSTHKNQTNVLSPKPNDHIKVKLDKEIIVQSPQPGNIGKLTKEKKLLK